MDQPKPVFEFFAVSGLTISFVGAWLRWHRRKPKPRKAQKRDLSIT